MPSFGVPELIIALVVLLGWLIPVLAAAWALITLHQLRVGQDALRARLDRMEELLQQR